jgi:hypothetical protein
MADLLFYSIVAIFRVFWLTFFLSVAIICLLTVDWTGFLIFMCLSLFCDYFVRNICTSA